MSSADDLGQKCQTYSKNFEIQIFNAIFGVSMKNGLNEMSSNKN